MPAEKEEGVKVCAVCPGLVATPLWDDPGLKAQFPGVEERSLSASTVANAMLSLAEEGIYGGGCIMTLTHEDGMKVLPEDEYWALFERVADTAYAPVREPLKEERDVGADNGQQGAVL
ncbi:hypothetical protein MMC28_000028 [Mycoblastus sanguinarius]|nr:hypothetical protein [Mycoblastus sanguinarius]